jgi:hypothetical protein
MATPHDERLKEFQRLIEAATRQLKVRHAARRTVAEEKEEAVET